MDHASLQAADRAYSHAGSDVRQQSAQTTPSHTTVLDVHIAIQEASALQKQANGDERAKDAIIEAGSHVQLLSTIAAFPNSEELCEIASDILCCVADREGKPRSSALVVAGAVPLLAAIAHMHGISLVARFFAQNALNKLGYRSDGNPKVNIRHQTQPPTSCLFFLSPPPFLPPLAPLNPPLPAGHQVGLSASKHNRSHGCLPR